MNNRISDLLYRVPDDLKVTDTPLNRVMVIGQCFVSAWPSILNDVRPGSNCDYYLFNNATQLPDQMPHPAEDYSFQLIHLPLRSVLPDATYFRLTYNDYKSYEDLFESCKDRIVQFLDAAMHWNKKFGILSFIANFTIPQMNPMGRLLPRYDLRNLVFFVEKLNEFLANQLSEYKNSYFFDYDQIIQTFGRKYIQDDIIWQTNHNSAFTDGDFERDGVRLEPALKASDLYPNSTYLYVKLGWTELLAMYRTIRQVDMVKLVILDIDDTLWRGIAAETTDHPSTMIEGWPMGIAEALGFLKRRGILLAIISKNEETLVQKIWAKLFHNRISLSEDFVSRKINWRPKPEYFELILQETNLLPRNVLFIDDNPVERAGMKSAFPDLRTIGATPLTWRRILLWSAEPQLANVTNESANRTDMVRAQVNREAQRKQLSREDFLKSLDLEITLSEIGGAEHPSFARAMELVNKSNQSNTTGKRWTAQEWSAAQAEGTRFFVFDVIDKFTDYGTVGVVIFRRNEISQFVMSCRVVGLEVELGVFSEILPIMKNSSSCENFEGVLKNTELNLLVRDLFQKTGFDDQGGELWTRSAELPFAKPPHIRIA